MLDFELEINGRMTGLRMRKAERFFERLKGLMGKGSADPGLLIPACNSIHTFFMKVPIDAVFTGPGGKVIKIIPGLRPWSIVPPVSGALDTFELGAGTLTKLGLKPGDIFSAGGV